MAKAQNLLNNDFKHWLDGLLDKHHVPGMSIAVIDGSHVDSAGYGLARLPDVPATPDTLYYMCSTTKAFTAALVGLLIHDEAKDYKQKASQRLKFSTPLTSILPNDFVTTEPYITRSTTIEDGLSHRSGIAGHDLFWGPAMTDASSVTNSIRHLGPITAPFRGKFQYNNLMYGVIGHVIEKSSGKSFAELLKARIWEPLGMSDSYSGVKQTSKALSENEDLSMARGYYWVDKEAGSDKAASKDSNEQPPKASGHYVPEGYIDLGAVGPAGDIVSTVKDYAKWVQALLAAVEPPEDDGETSKKESKASKDPDQVVTHDLFRDVTTPRSFNLPIVIPSPDVAILPPNPHITPPIYALGWTLNPFIAPGEQVVEHAGGINGFSTHVFLLPNHNFGIVLASNATGPAYNTCEVAARELIKRKIGKGLERKGDSETADHGEKQGTDNVPEQVELTDVPTEGSQVNDTTNPRSASDRFDDKDIGIVSHYTQPAYGTFVVSRATPESSLGAEKPKLDGVRIEKRKAKSDTKPDKDHAGPLKVKPIPARGLPWNVLLHNPRQASDNQSRIIYDLEMLMNHGDLSNDALNVKQDFPPDAEKSENYPLKDEPVWQSQKIDKKGAVAELGEDGQVKKLGLQLFRVDVPEKSGEEMPEDELEEGWQDRLVWFDKAGAQ